MCSGIGLNTCAEGFGMYVGTGRTLRYTGLYLFAAEVCQVSSERARRTHSELVDDMRESREREEERRKKDRRNGSYSEGGKRDCIISSSEGEKLETSPSKAYNERPRVAGGTADVRRTT